MSLLAVFSNCTKRTDEVASPYFPKVKSIISNNCLSCHSSKGSWLGRPTAFDNDEEITASYNSIKAVLVDPPTQFNKRMPQTGMLSAGDIDIVVKWWEKGGKSTD